MNLEPNLDRPHLLAMQLNADGSLLAVTMDLGVVAVYELSALRPGCVSTILPPVPLVQHVLQHLVAHFGKTHQVKYMNFCKIMMGCSAIPWMGS